MEHHVVRVLHGSDEIGGVQQSPEVPVGAVVMSEDGDPHRLDVANALLSCLEQHLHVVGELLRMKLTGEP